MINNHGLIMSKAPAATANPLLGGYTEIHGYIHPITTTTAAIQAPNHPEISKPNTTANSPFNTSRNSSKTKEGE